MSDGTPEPNAEKKHSKKRLQCSFIENLMGGGSITDAAKKSGISRRTAHRWLNDESFKRRYRRAREAAITGAVGLLHANTSAAVSTLLVEMLNAETPAAVKIQAANALLSWSVRFAEVLDVSDRLNKLEAAAKT